MKKRKLVLQNKISTFTVTKGEKFALDVKKAAAEITAEMIATGAWKQTEFKPYNMKALGMDIGAGNLHPLHKVKTEIRQILLLMGFQEMKTNQFVESSSGTPTCSTSRSSIRLATRTTRSSSRS